MSLRNIYDLYQTMERDNTMLSFKGIVTSDLLTSVLHIMESKLNYIEESPKTKKKVYNVLVECLQNLYHHIDPEEAKENKLANFLDSKSSLLMISKMEENYEVRTGNYIQNDQVEDLRGKLDLINSMDKGELREFYKSILSNGERSAKGTAGLGMIDIARKSGNKLDYEFLPVDDKISFFCLNVKIA